MKHYKVKALTVTGKGNKIYRSGQSVNEQNFIPGMADKLVELGFLTLTGSSAAKLIPPVPLPINGKIRLAISAAVWKRPAVFELFAKGIHKLNDVDSTVEIHTIIAGSEGDVSKQMVEKHGFIYVEMPNDPLAKKFNQTTLIAKQLKCDYVLCLGSDDIISPELLKYYITQMRKGIDYIGVTDFYFYDTVSKKAAYWGGYRDKRKGHTAGAGRLLSSRILNEWNWQPWEIKDSRVLDNSMQNKLLTTPHTASIFSLKEKGLFALDIKSDTNMTPFNLWDNTEFIPTDIIKNKFPFVCAG